MPELLNAPKGISLSDVIVMPYRHREKMLVLKFIAMAKGGKRWQAVASFTIKQKEFQNIFLKALPIPEALPKGSKWKLISKKKKVRHFPFEKISKCK